MGAIAALLALGGIVALAAYSAGNEEAAPSSGHPPAGAPPAFPPPPGAPSGVRSAPPAEPSATPGPSPAAAPSPTPTSHAPEGADPYAATPVPSHCPSGLDRADPTARALCGPGGADASAPVVPTSTATNAPPDLVERVRAFMASDPSPEQIEELAMQLERAGLPDAARQLRGVAAVRRQERARAPSPSPPPSPGPSSPARSDSRTPAPSSSSATDSASSSRPGGGGEPQSGRQLAAETARALRDRLSELQRLTREFQEAANIEADGLYGPMTRAALTYWSGRTAPRPWVGSGSPRYRGLVSVERGSGSPAAEHAERTARALFRALLDPEGPAKPILERFQRTVGLTVDGKYGSQTRAALGRLGVANPPKAFRRARRRASRGSGGGGSSRRRSG